MEVAAATTAFSDATGKQPEGALANVLREINGLSVIQFLFSLVIGETFAIYYCILYGAAGALFWCCMEIVPLLALGLYLKNAKFRLAIHFFVLEILHGTGKLLTVIFFCWIFFSQEILYLQSAFTYDAPISNIRKINESDSIAISGIFWWLHLGPDQLLAAHSMDDRMKEVVVWRLINEVVVWLLLGIASYQALPSDMPLNARMPVSGYGPYHSNQGIPGMPLSRIPLGLQEFRRLSGPYPTPSARRSPASSSPKLSEPREKLVKLFCLGSPDDAFTPTVFYKEELESLGLENLLLLPQDNRRISSIHYSRLPITWQHWH